MSDNFAEFEHFIMSKMWFILESFDSYLPYDWKPLKLNLEESYKDWCDSMLEEICIAYRIPMEFFKYER